MSKLKDKKIRTLIREHRQFLEDNFSVKKIGVFGSYARGGNNKSSDIDMIVEFSSPIGFFAFIRLERYLSKILKRKVDLVTKRAIKPAIKNQVLKELIFI